jgi:hypothetical protein
MNNKLILKAVVGAAAAALSFILALGAWAFYTNTGLRTPGILAWDIIVAPDGSSKAAASFGKMFAVQLTVDWILWLAVMLAIYFLVTRLNRRLKRPR